MCHGDGVEVLESTAGFIERFAQDGENVLDMRAARDLGHDAAIFFMQFKLRRHNVAAHIKPVGDHRRRSFIAGGFDAKDE